MVKGIISIDELNDELGLRLEESEEYDTLGGLLIKLVGHIPTEGEQCLIEYNGLVFKIEEVKGKRIEIVKITVVK